ncbi:hypothetical protein Tco_0121764 [Tanacetum coccineum]
MMMKDDDDDEGPSAGSNQGKSTKRRRSDSATSGSAKPLPKDDDQSLKKPRESEASASKQHPTLTLTGCRSRDTREGLMKGMGLNKTYTDQSLSQEQLSTEQKYQRKQMRLNDFTSLVNEELDKVMEKLDHMVKDFHLYEYNKGMETRKWSEDDKRRSKDFITAIEKRLQIRRIYRSLESFVGGRIRDIDYRLINRTT